MAGWACTFQLRALEIIDEQEDGTVMSIGDFLKHERVDGLFDREKRIGDGLEKLCEVALETISAIHPQKLEVIKDGDKVKHYVILGTA
jgi:hypothetical protein